MAKRITTQEKILNAAEALFAEQGFEQTSLRQITTEAAVNLASVNYHFGSKKALIQAVMARYLEIFMPALRTQLEGLGAKGSFTTRDVFDRFRTPLSELRQVRKHGPTLFLSLLGFAYAEIQGHLRRYTMEHFGDVMALLLDTLHQANPKLSPVDMFWRLHFVLGATVFAQVSGPALREIAAADFGEAVAADQVIDRLIPFLAGGVDATTAE
ncbi:TetR family transcriptional regulator [Pseudidiomarina sp. 1APP75-32.1]|uniref:TetR family transcriptional regulator n=1 Tax=Pseudidiomarina terrestris TaxID=2820060 RepID=A0AAW7QUH8_9GAMM|nr:MULTISPECIES: TetR/AcrR family transcriptional regulator [unclassified Pseudidiomarina]MDN7123374.1 TetR family transcriptional regulator [Pseudidiomarina sp. 1APP75-32.1]MDN7127794.1 TetR family transcriptional regulator [Pseudidiomarina sp. 1APR75-33.1]MDN7128901.1 TetR family transcriptional regulator [Pseudidiomarina sp. 1APR75-15]MDN7137514.1 TetR family transcriptional regulator [Pseudidiomarina sp. 1ASP75-14]MEA3587376.1 TetR family transcriptional regulator [Pseudidiomarina sp. 1APP